MNSETVLIVCVAAVVIAVLAVIAYYLARAAKGSITLNLPRTTFHGGESIAGTFKLHTRKAVQGKRLIVQLVGREVSTNHGSQQHGTRTQSREIYRDEVVLEGAKQYAPGKVASYDFEIAAPGAPAGNEMVNSTLGKALTTAVKVLGNRSVKVKWKIEARLDAKGVDLARSKAISINL